MSLLRVYFIIYVLFVIFISTTNGAYATFRGASKGIYNFLGSVTALGLILLLIAFVCHFFIITWWKALLIIIGTLVFAPAIGMRLGKIPFLGFFTAILGIITAFPLVIILIGLLNK